MEKGLRAVFTFSSLQEGDMQNAGPVIHKELNDLWNKGPAFGEQAKCISNILTSATPRYIGLVILLSSGKDRVITSLNVLAKVFLHL